MLARCLSESEAFFALKEPWILRRIADLKRGCKTSAAKRRWQQQSKLYLRLLCRKYSTGESLIIKPTNVANNLIADVCHWLPTARVLYLHSGLESFLISNIKKPAETKRNMPSLLEALLKDSNIRSLCRANTDFGKLTFLQTCAAVWLASLHALQRQCEQTAGDRVRSLEMDLLLRSPAVALTLASRFFGRPPTTEQLDQMMSPSVLGTHAKSQSTYSVEQRTHEYVQIFRANRRDIERTIFWAEPIVQQLGVREFMNEIDLRRRSE